MLARRTIVVGNGKRAHGMHIGFETGPAPPRSGEWENHGRLCDRG